jgi:hypothetical protein
MRSILIIKISIHVTNESHHGLIEPDLINIHRRLLAVKELKLIL